MGSLAETMQIGALIQKSGHENYVSRSQEWTRLVDELTVPACVIEKCVDQALSERRGGRASLPQRAAVLGETPSTLLGALMLRMKGLEVIFLNMEIGAGTPARPANEIGPTRDESRITHSILATLAGEVCAFYVDAQNIPIPRIFEEVGPFDLMLVCGSNCTVIQKALMGPSDSGVLVDVSEGGGPARVYQAEPSSCLVFRREIQVDPQAVARELDLRTSRKLALADIEYPGWLGKSLEFAREENLILASL